MSKVAIVLRVLRLIIFQLIEKLFRRFSLVGDSPFYAVERFPWIRDVELKSFAIRNELLAVMANLDEVPNFQDISVEQALITRDDLWKTYFFKVYGQDIVANAQRCPETAKALACIPGHMTAFFSVLMPHKEIPPHRGPYGGVLRYHLGVLVPEPDACSIKVGTEVRHWCEGRSLVFDDTYMHSVSNQSSRPRVVLFVDFKRPLPFALRLLNNTVLAALAWSPFISGAIHRQRDWDRRLQQQYQAVNK